MVTKYCMYVCISRYGYAMSRPMPTGNFRWLTDAEIKRFNPLEDISEDDDCKEGYIVECTLEYPNKMHSAHNSIPLAPHKQVINDDMLSPYAKEALAALRKKGGTYKATKLTSTFQWREEYVLHGQNLKLYLQLGLRLVAIHRVIKFDQAPFIKPYIEFCSKMRAESKTKSRSSIFNRKRSFR